MRRDMGVHIVPKRLGSHTWIVELNGAPQRTFDNQKKAIFFGTLLAKSHQTQLFIHGRDGTIRDRSSYVPSSSSSSIS